ncbi:WbqC family protein [Rubrolithibacter danxiaensis]|uniref:WbqC family protein n=1 Tax=Rubrolithibacter danxiaensis TaxID=3390805 RepID=UPI003BF82652
MNKGAILPLFYLPPIEYFNVLIKNRSNFLIEQFEHFPKQTYRNRAIIQSTNGKLNLIVPVIKGSKVHTKVRDVKISHDFNWQRLHWMSLQTSYRSSAFFEFYEDAFAPFFEKKWDFIFDYNMEILQLLLKLLKIDSQYQLTDVYEGSYPGWEDYRESIHPKINSSYTAKPYFQVFEEKNSFMPNLSIVDLLFNQGPQSTHFI